MGGGVGGGAGCNDGCGVAARAAVWRLARTSQLPPLAPRGNALVFSHLSFQEHLSAEASGAVALFGDTDKLDSPWWSDVLLASWSLAGAAEREEAIAALDGSARRLEAGGVFEVATEGGHVIGSTVRNSRARRVTQTPAAARPPLRTFTVGATAARLSGGQPLQ